MLPSSRGKCGSEGAKWGCEGGNQDAAFSRFAPAPWVMPVNTQKSSAPPSRAPIAIAGEIHRQLLIRGDPSDEEMSGYKTLYSTHSTLDSAALCYSDSIALL